MQRLEQLEGLGRQVDFLAAAQELPRLGVEGQLAKCRVSRPLL